MLKTGLVVILFLVMGKCYSQENHSITIQSDNNQPFYATLEGKVFPSTSSGHLMLSRPGDSVYEVTIGFPGGLYSGQRYSLKIGKEDLHLELKISGGKEWRLLDLQNSEFKTPLQGSGIGPGDALKGVKKDDAFSRLMAGVVNDSAVMYADFIADQAPTDEKVEEKSAPKPAETTVEKPEKPAERPIGETSTVPLNKDSASAKSPGIVKDSTTKGTIPVIGKKIVDSTGDSAIVLISSSLKDSSANTTPSVKTTTSPEKITTREAVRGTETVSPVKEKTPYIEKVSEKKTAHQVRILYVDHGRTGRGDTIVIRIPLDTVATITSGKNSTSKGKIPDAHPPVNHPLPKDSAAVPLSTDPGTAVGPDAAPLLKKPVLVNSDCRNFASNIDIEKLREKMMTAVSDKDRVDQATKFFRTRCVTTAQIRTLNRLFMNDEGSFQFFRAAYPFVTDSDQFKSLVNLFTDPLVIGKFKKMTGQP